MVGEASELSGFVALARVLSPAAAGQVDVIELDEGWRAAPGSRSATWTIWGRMPAHGLSAPNAVAFAIRRELAIWELRRGVSSNGIRRLHRLNPAEHGGRGGLARRFLLQGAAAELGAEADLTPAYEGILAEAQVDIDQLKLGASRDGSVRIAGDVGGRPVLVRLGIPDSPTDPSRNADALRQLGEMTVGCVPTLVGEGRHGGIAWTVESRLAGGNPHRLASRQWSDAMQFLAHLVTNRAGPRAVREQTAYLIALLPERSVPLSALGERTEAALTGLPSVIQHGDFFGDNLLVQGSRLTGVVDWGTWTSAGTPGVDLLELYATDRGQRRPAEFARILTDGVWRSDEFLDLTAEYWRAIGVPPSEETLKAIASAWWVSGMAALLARPDRRKLVSQPAWVEREVDQVLHVMTARPE